MKTLCNTKQLLLRKCLLIASISLTGCNNDDNGDYNSLQKKPTFEASDCFNPVFAQTGTTTDLTFEDTLYSPVQASASESTSTIMNLTTKIIHTKNLGETTFNGQNVSRIQNITNDSYNTLTEDQYYQFNTDTNKSVLYVGSYMNQGSNSFSRDTNTPGALMRFDLNAGDSYMDNYQFTNQSESYSSPCNAQPGTYCPASISASGVAAGSNNVKMTYLGKESINVPAGQFTSCKFLKNETRTYNTGSTSNTLTTLWYAVGSGVLVKSETARNVEASHTLVLKSAKINDVLITIK